MEGVSTCASNCTAQTCPLLLLSASSIRSRVPIRNQQDWSFLFSFQAPWEGEKRHKRKGLQDQEWWECSSQAEEGKQQVTFGNN